MPRIIITIFGKITFIHTKYQYFDQELNKYKSVYLLDNYIQIEPYQRMNLHLWLEIMKQLGAGKRQRDIVDQFKIAGITRVSISNLARNIDTKDLNESSHKIPVEAQKNQYIYIKLKLMILSLVYVKIKLKVNIEFV